MTDGRTDRRTDGPTDGRTDTLSYRNARTHLKTYEPEFSKKFQGFNKRKNDFAAKSPIFEGYERNISILIKQDVILITFLRDLV